MTYKTILAHFPDAGCVSPILDVALPLAEQHEAHLIGLHVVPQPHVYWAAAAEMSAAVLDAQREFFDDLARTTADAFAERTRNETVMCEWRHSDSAGLPIADRIAGHAAACDLVIMRNSGPDDEWATQADLPARVILASGRPTLVLPHDGVKSDIGKYITVAWDGGREAARATFDALPLLRQAEEVRLFSIDYDDTSPRYAFTPADEIAVCLDRHGVRATAQRQRSGANAGEALLSYAAEHGSDLLVMGCFGHARLRELVFGGATRHILKHATLPLLMSH